MNGKWTNLKRSYHVFDYFLVVESFWWVFVFVFPYGTFTYARIGSFSLLTGLISNTTLGLLIAIATVVLFFSLFYRIHALYRLALFGQVVWYVLLSIDIIVGSPTSTGTMVYSLIALMALYQLLTTTDKGQGDATRMEPS